MATYSTIQEMFLLNISSNKGASLTGPNLEDQILQKILAFYKDYQINDWQVVWGPGVYVKTQGHTPDNVAYIAYNATTSSYFLSVAGTNPLSIVDWMEDLNTGTTVAWPWNTTGNSGQIAAGSNDALGVIVNLQGREVVGGVHSGDPMTIQAYLQTVTGQKPPGSCSLITGGHSLGGALSPLAALWLADTQDAYDPAEVIGNFSSWPSAGPTAGDADFKAYYDSRIPQTYRIHNTIDVVPHAWNLADLNAIKTLYAPGIGHSDCVDWLVDREIKKVQSIDYQQAGLQDKPLSGTVNPSIIKRYLPNGINFGLQLDYQHINAYFDLLGLTADASFKIENILSQREAYWSGVAATVKTASRVSQ
jgi:hypothetical protein